MAILKCKMCGGDIEISADKTFGTCDSCGSMMTFPKVSDEQRADAFNRGNHFRRIGEFDKALQVYERIVQEDPTDAEAHWCCALCRFGIEWVEDPATTEYLPTCHRASFDIFTEDVDYKEAVSLSEGVTQKQYIRDGARITDVQRGILAASQNEKPYDVFICYKESDENGQRTVDSTLAQDIYYQLTDAGLRVFFARITLEDKAGSEYEPYIFAALNSAKAMVVVGTKPEHFGAVWVKNEWSRYLAIVKRDRSKVLLPCYKGMDPYDLPEQLSVLQSYDMSKIGFIQDLIRGIKKITATEETKTAVKETVVVENGNINTAALLERAFMFLEDGSWQDANEYCEKVLDQNPKDARAYLGKLMAELKVRKQEDLKDCEKPFDTLNNYQKILRFADPALADTVKGYISFITERNLNARYENALSDFEDAGTEEAFKKAAESFRKLDGYKDADTMIERCLQKADECVKDSQYEKAVMALSGSHIWVGKFGIHPLEESIEILKSLNGWKDADKQIEACQKKIEEIKAKDEADRIAAEKAAKKRKKAFAIGTPIVAACIAFVIVLTTVIIPNNKYNAAVALMNNKEYDEAITAFEALNGYKDSKDKISLCQTALKDIDYNTAVSLMDACKYDEAITAFEALNGYKDSKDKALECLFIVQKPNLSGIKKGDTIKFGFYEQDNNTTNGKEEIEWIVLNVEGSKALVISKYALDCQQYNTSCTDVTWEKCTLRKWLNDSFLNTAFSAKHQELIPSVSVFAEKNPEYSTNPGNSTNDKVFLLNYREAKKYFTTDESRKCAPTAFAKAQGADTDYGYIKTASGEPTCEWWPRSPGCYQDFAAYVRIDGPVSCLGHTVDAADVCVRPALWINYGGESDE